jgi:hypothetical protein
MNRIIGGWCRYYQYTSKASTQFNRLNHYAYWKMGHWLGRKLQLSMPEVIKRYMRDGTWATSKYHLIKASDFQTLFYKKRFLKPNPYTMQEQLQREELPHETYWTGHEPRPGMADLQPLILARDGYVCQRCNKRVTSDEAHIDHIKPVRRFKRPVDANYSDNLWTLCIECHKEKTKYDRQMESRVRGDSLARFCGDCALHAHKV